MAKNWVFTINNYVSAEDLFERVSANEICAYLVFQTECGTNGTPHIQGYIQLTQRKRLNQVKEIVSDHGHFEIARGKPQQCKAYCTKVETRTGGPWEYGNMTSPGRRNDLVIARELIKNNPHISISDLAEEVPDVLAKYPRFISTLKKEYARPTRTPLIPRDGWQSLLSTLLNGQPDGRQVNWYWEATGNVGKSYFALNFKHIGGRYGYVVTGGRHSDIFYGYDYEPVVFFDWTRDNQETVPYSVMESFKNGYYLNTKYESAPVRFSVPHVVVFANFPPDISKLSIDRWNIFQI